MAYPRAKYLPFVLLMLAAADVRAQSGPSLPLQRAGNPGLSSVATALRSPGYIDLLGGFAYTSNAFQTPGHPLADGIGFAGVDIDYIHLGTELTVDALGDVDRLWYVKGSFPSTFYGEFNGSALWGSSKDILQWVVSDAFGEGMLNPLASPTPANLQWINYARTGPYLNFNMGSANRLTLFGLYARTTFESSPFDMQSYQGGASLRHALTPVSSFSVQVTDTRIDFVDSDVAKSYPGAASGGYDIRAATLGYSSELGRTHFSVFGGYNTVDYGGRNRGAPLAVLQFERETSPSSSVFFTGETGYSTLGNSLLSPTSGVNTVGTQQILGTGAGALAGTASPVPFNNTRGSIGWAYHRLRTTLTLFGTAGDQHYVEQSTFNQTSASVNASLRRELGPTLFVQLQGIETYSRFGQISANNRTTTAHFSLSRRFRKMVLSAYAQWLHEHSSAGSSVLPVASFSDVRAGIELSYDLVGHRVAGLTPF